MIRLYCTGWVLYVYLFEIHSEDFKPEKPINRMELKTEKPLKIKSTTIIELHTTINNTNENM